MLNPATPRSTSDRMRFLTEISHSFKIVLSSRNNRVALALLVVLLATFLCYIPTLSNDFVYLDDDSHLLDNAFIRGLDAEHIKLMFTQTVQNVYVPLTFLSFALEYHFFQYDPLIYHLDNLLLHMGVTALVFFFALQLGLSVAGAFFAAILFGVHPMHVESVSWVTERKDVLFALFYMMALCAYWRYLVTDKMTFYAVSIVCGLLSILSKPMALSLPLILFVCDWFKGRSFSKSMFWDKVPYFLYIVPIAWITYALNARVPGQNPADAVLICVWTAVFYIRKFIFPFILVPMYDLPHPVSLLNPEFLLSVLLLIFVLAVLFRFRRNRWLMFASLYYVLSMFFLFRYDDVVDKSIVADRFLYLPCLGICFLAGYGWGRLCAVLSGRRSSLRYAAGVLASILICTLGVKTFMQTRIWNNSISFGLM